MDDLGPDSGVRDVLRIDVHRPIKRPDRYEFHCDVTGQPFTRSVAVRRLKSLLQGYGSPFTTRWRFGFRAVNFTIAHCEVWDSVFPLMFLTRNEGPLFKTPYSAAVIRFRYPILEPVRRFFVQRAANFGLSIEIEADTLELTFEVRGRGSIVSFGGGKESRLLVGLLSELGRAPRIIETGFEYSAGDLPAIERAQPFRGVLAERVLPGLMAGAAHFYFGGSLGEVHATRPWHQHYDLSSSQGQHELGELLRSLGVEITLHGPASVLPSNLIQKMLAARYPALYAHQRSVNPGVPSEKNLHVSLLKLYHDLAFDEHCQTDLFRRLLDGFVAQKLARPGDFGFRTCREVLQREMMAIIARRRSDPRLRDVGATVPTDWDASWIDFIHPYANPNLEPALLDIFHQYANDYRPAPGDYRVPTGDRPAPGADDGHV